MTSPPPLPSLSTHARSYWRGRSPSFDGLHAKDFPIGWMFQNNAFENYKIIELGVWTKVGEHSEGWEDLPDLDHTPPHSPPEEPEIPKRKRGRPKKSKKAYKLKNPSPWQLFVKEHMQGLEGTGMNGREKLKYLSNIWKQQ